jgi:hypothetical protein
MKKLLILFVFIPFISFSQKKTDSVVFKGATKIIVKNSLSAEDNYKLAIKTFMDNEYSIDSKDNELFFFKTQVQKIPKSTYSNFFNVKTKEGEIVIEGRFKTGITVMVYGVQDQDEFEPTMYRSLAGYKLAFKSMENAAKIFSMPLIYSN